MSFLPRFHLLTAVALGVAALPVSASVAGPADGGLIGAVEVGYDRFAQVYRVTEELDIVDLADLNQPGLGSSALRDTTDIFTEMRALVELGAVDKNGGHRWDVRGRFSGGSDLWRQSFVMDYRYRPEHGRRRFDLDVDVDGRQFRNESDFSLSSDNLRAVTRGHWRSKLNDSAELGVKLRAELLRYDRRSEFEYDQNKWAASATAQLRHGWNLSANLELGGGARAVPDSNEIAYRRGFFRGDLYWAPGLSTQVGLFTVAERRVFDDGDIRTHYWDVVVEPEISFQLSDDLRLRLPAPQEWLLYDQDSAVYYDIWLGRVGSELSKQWGDLELGLEPRWSWLISPLDVEDEYVQPSVVLHADWFGTGRLWFSLVEEIGRRLYEAVPDGGLEIYSDYTFFRTTLLASVGIGSNLSLDGFLSDEPESHRREEHDSRLTLYSLALRASF